MTEESNEVRKKSSGYSIRGMIKGILLGLFLSILFSYDRWRVSFEFNYGTAIILGLSFGLLGLLWGDCFIKGFFDLIAWFSGEKIDNK